MADKPMFRRTLLIAAVFMGLSTLVGCTQKDEGAANYEGPRGSTKPGVPTSGMTTGVPRKIAPVAPNAGGSRPMAAPR